MRRTAAVASAYVEPTELGSEVERCWREITKHYPEVSVLAFQVMPDHIHGMLFVTHEMAVHLGKVINGFKVGYNRAYRRLVLGSSEAMPQKRGTGGQNRKAEAGWLRRKGETARLQAPRAWHALCAGLS